MAVTEYLADDLVASAKLRGFLPTGTLSTTDLLRFATEEMRTDLVPLILSAREDYFTAFTDYTPVIYSTDVSGKTMGPFRLPGRAIGNKARLVQLINQNGDALDIGRIPLEIVPFERRGFYIRGNAVYVLDTSGAVYSAIRIYYHSRPNALVTATAVAFVQSFNPTAKTITFASVPTAWATGTFDIVGATPPFDLLAFDAAATLGGSTLTFSAALPAGLAVGDQVSIAGQSAIVQLPIEFHPVLSQAITAKCMEAAGDMQGLQAAYGKLKEMKGAALQLVTNRSEGNPKLMINVRSPWRRYY